MLSSPYPERASTATDVSFGADRTLHKIDDIVTQAVTTLVTQSINCLSGEMFIKGNVQSLMHVSGEKAIGEMAFGEMVPNLTLL